MAEKSNVVAGVLGICLGGIGIHKFYMGKIGMGILYVLFFWTGIPALIGFIEGIIYLAEGQEKFNKRVTNEPTVIHHIHYNS